MTDPHSGQGGSYLAGPDGSRVLQFRTGIGAVTPEPAPKQTTKRKPQIETQQEEMTNGEMA